MRGPKRMISFSEKPSESVPITIVVGRKARPTSSGAVAEDPLQVEGAEEEHPEHAGDEQRLQDVGAGDVAGAEEAQRHQRVGDPRLAVDEGGEQGRGDRR